MINATTTIYTRTDISFKTTVFGSASVSYIPSPTVTDFPLVEERFNATVTETSSALLVCSYNGTPPTSSENFYVIKCISPSSSNGSMSLKALGVIMLMFLLLL